MMIDFFGPLPAAWWEIWDAEEGVSSGQRHGHNGRRLLYVRNGAAVYTNDKPQKTLEEHFEFHFRKMRRTWGESAVPSKDEELAFLDFLRASLALDPSKRATANEALQSRWMLEYALPLAEKSWGQAIV